MTQSILVYDCFSGISGDMHIGAMIDLGVPVDYLQSHLARLSLADEFVLEIANETKMGISGTKATVRLKAHEHHHRHLPDIRKIIESAGYDPAVNKRALGIFMEIAVAEAKIHGIDLESVHFHEVGATDSIVDVVAAAICLDHLNVDRVHCANVEVGGGMVKCAHGLMPVPAPATAEILKGVPCRYDGVSSEATTPTGAAILKNTVTDFSAPEGFVVDKVAYGLGQKDFEIPNVLRVMLGSSAASAGQSWYESETNQLIECNIDDMTAEAFQPMVEKLLASGAKDVFLDAIIMKKSRPGTRVSVLADDRDADGILRVLFANSTTIGVRVHSVEKRMLPRSVEAVATSLGEVSVKVASLPDGTRRWKIEHDDVVRLAADTGEDYLRIRNLLNREIATQLDTPDD